MYDSHAGFLVFKSQAPGVWDSPRLFFAILGGWIVTILLVCINRHKKTTNLVFLYTNLFNFGAAFSAAKGGRKALLTIKSQVDRTWPPGGCPLVRMRSGMN
jgi:ABC-type Fe3+-siderophore transport system permease subunit